jgi:hypothetical protein
MLIKVLMVLLMVSMAHTEWRWATDTNETLYCHGKSMVLGAEMDFLNTI